MGPDAPGGLSMPWMPLLRGAQRFVGPLFERPSSRPWSSVLRTRDGPEGIANLPHQQYGT